MPKGKEWPGVTSHFQLTALSDFREKLRLGFSLVPQPEAIG